MGVWRRLLSGRGDGETAGHPEMGHQRVTLVELEHQELPMPADLLDLAGSETVHHLGRRGVVTRRAVAADSNRNHPAAEHRLFEMTPRRFDFGQFGQPGLLTGTVTVPIEWTYLRGRSAKFWVMGCKHWLGCGAHW